MKRLVPFLVILPLAAVVVALVVVYGGLYNVAASSGHSALERRFFSTVRAESVEARSDDIEVPPFDDPRMVELGVGYYAPMCTTCHGAPGVPASEIGKGLNPEPPDLARIAGDRSDQELFWVVKHGLKMTGMPAFGPTHSDEQLWPIVAFLRKLPGLSAPQYKQLVVKVLGPSGLMEGGHTHGEIGGEGHPHGPGAQELGGAPGHAGMPTAETTDMEGHAGHDQGPAGEMPSSEDGHAHQHGPAAGTAPAPAAGPAAHAVYHDAPGMALETPEAQGEHQGHDRRPAADAPAEGGAQGGHGRMPVTEVPSGQEDRGSPGQVPTGQAPAIHPNVDGGRASRHEFMPEADHPANPAAAAAPVPTPSTTLSIDRALVPAAAPRQAGENAMGHQHHAPAAPALPPAGSPAAEPTIPVAPDAGHDHHQHGSTEEQGTGTAEEAEQ
ncbi:MAG: cytochrome c [Candidatus Schekmanbacteria bacterium]|nr:cytochrome c [Candidatus Schekmanbacteria bacterium]